MKMEKLKNNLEDLIIFCEYYTKDNFLVTDEMKDSSFCNIVGNEKMEKVIKLMDNLNNKKISNFIGGVIIMEFIMKAYFIMFLGGFYSSKDYEIKLAVNCLKYKMEEMKANLQRQ